jgi:peptide methionine sulfoxide reductase MsrB
MNCPLCGVEIEFVIVESPVTQRGYLKDNKITSYSDTMSVGASTEITCPECDGDLKGTVIEDDEDEDVT